MTASSSNLSTLDSTLEQQVVTDDLTGLYNRRYLNSRLRQETERSLETHSHFSLLMLDLDHFKEVNDRYGHSEGDQALLWVSNILKLSVRSEDVVIRFAGDEFFIILPGAGLAETEAVAKRIYGLIVQNPFRGSKQQVQTVLGVSAGLALFPEDASSPEELMRSADKGLYLAKEQGRGRFCLASEASHFHEKRLDPSLLAIPPFSGREEQIKKLRDLLDQTEKSGERNTVWVRGPSGIGKTRLLAEFISKIRREPLFILSSVCQPQGAEIPCFSFIDLLNQWVEKQPEHFKACFSLLPKKEQGELLQLAPSLEAAGYATHSNDSPRDRDASSLYYGLAHLFKMAAGRGTLVLSFEDLHWMDPASMELLTHVMAQTAACPVLFLLSAQMPLPEKNKQEPIIACLRPLERDARFTSLSLPPLEDRHIRALVQKIFRPDSPRELFAVEEILIRETEGNPLFIKEVLWKLVDEKNLFLTPAGWRIDLEQSVTLPEKVRDVIDERLRKLPEDTKQVLQMAAAIGREFSFEVLKAVSEKNEGHLLDLLDQALSQGLVEEIQSVKWEMHRFTSHNVQKVLYESLSQARRKRIHQKIVESLEKCFSASLDEVLELLFYHSKLAKLPERHFEYGVKSGLKAFKNHGLREAEHFFEQAQPVFLELSPAVKEALHSVYQDGALCRAETLIYLGRYKQAKEWLETLPEWPQKQLLLAQTFMRLGIYGKAQVLYEQSIKNTEEPRLQSRIESEFSELFHRQGLFPLAEKHATLALSLARNLKNPALEAEAHKALGRAQLAQNQLLQAQKSNRKSLRGYCKLLDRRGMAGCLTNIGTIAFERKKYQQAEKWFLRAKTLCEETGFHSLKVHLLNNLGAVYFQADKTDEAHNSYSECLQIASDQGDTSAMIASGLNLGGVHEKTDPKKCETYLKNVLKLCRQVGDKNQESLVYRRLGDLAAHADNDEKSAEALFLKSLELAHGVGDEAQEVIARIKLIESLHRQNQKEKALDWLKGTGAVFDAWRAPLQGMKMRLKKELDHLRALLREGETP